MRRSVGAVVFCFAPALALAGCAAAVPGSSPDGGTTDAAVTDAPPAPAVCPMRAYDAGGRGLDLPSREAVLAAPALAAAQVTRSDEECSGAGGTHLTLRVAYTACGLAVRTAALGDHAFYPTPTLPVGAWVVVGLDPTQPLSEADRLNAGWCLTGLPAVEANAIGWLPATSEADARAQATALLR